MYIIDKNTLFLVDKKYINSLWNKSKGLYMLTNFNNFFIPKTLIIRWIDIQDKCLSFGKLKPILAELFWNNKIIIRSDSKIEDWKKTSYAWRFLSIWNTWINDVEKWIMRVYDSQKQIIKDCNNIWVIIQEYIECDYSWVIFSADPNNETNYWIIEYSKGNCEKLVSWFVTPKKMYYPRWENKLNSFISKVRIFNTLKQIGNQIENHAQYPQDIEFWIKNNKIWIFQSRNITTLSEEYCSIIKSEDLDKHINSSYYLYRNEICEVLPNPKTFELDLIATFLSQYAWKIYQKYWIKYHYTNYLETISWKLYINWEKELNSIISNATLIWKKSIYNKPRYKNKNFLKIFKDIKNIFYTSLMPNKIDAEIENFESALIKLTNKIIQKINNNSFDYNLFISEFFEEYYSLIFEINICTNSYIKIYWNILKEKDYDFYYNTKNEAEWNNIINKIDKIELIWNSISFQDYNKTIIWENYWKSITIDNSWFRNNKITNLNKLLELREKSRILSVLCVNLIRKNLLNQLWDNYLDYDVTLNLKKQSKKINHNWIIPRILSNPCLKADNNEKKSIWYNSIWKWVLMLYDWKDGNIKGIIYTNELLTEIALSINKISWIITNNWWELSHLAIIARENKIPIISWYKLDEIKEYIWKKVIINSQDSLLKTE